MADRDTSSSDIQSAMVEDVLENSLPVHVASLMLARTENTAETIKLQEELKVLKKQSSKGKQEIKRLTVEANTLISNICTCEEEGSKVAVHITELEKEISRAFEERENLKLRLQLKEQQLSLSDRTYLSYKKVMESYKQIVKYTETNCNALSELDAVKKELEVLKTKKTEMDIVYQEMINQVGGDEITSVDIREELMLLEHDVDKERSILDHTKAKLSDCQKKILEMETANGIIKKKNSALLTRLKCQVKERKERHEQVTSHIQSILDKIEVTKLKLDKIATKHKSNGDL